MRTGYALIAMCLAAGLLLPAGRSLQAQSTTDVFDGQALHEIRLHLNSREHRQIRERFMEDTYYPADMIWRNTTRVRNVAVRSRGVASRNPTKLGLRVDFNRYTTGQQFQGLKSIVLDNLWKDPSMIREAVAMAFFRRMGQPASRVSYARLYINNELQGLYAIVESLDNDYLMRYLGENAGYLHEFRYAGPYHFEHLGDDLGLYKPFFTPQNHELDADAMLYGPIRDLIREANQPVDAVWRERVEALIDLTQLVTYIAIETFLAEDDGFLGSAGMANFYLYRQSGTNRHRVLPWDKDTTLQYLDPDMFPRVQENVIVSRALSFPDLRTTYLNVLEDCARRAAEDNWLANEIERLIALAGDAARQDTRKLFTNEEFELAIAFLREFGATRPAQVLTEVAKVR